MSLHAAVYARLSQTKGNGQDVSIQAQLDALHTAISQAGLFHDCASDDYVEEKGHRSGGSAAGRPAYRRLMERVEAHLYSHLYVYDLSRFDRSYDLMSILLGLQQKQVKFCALNDAVDLDSPIGEFMTAIKGNINAYRRKEDGDKLARRLAEYRAAGAWVGFPPQGLTVTGHGKDRRLIVRMESYSVNGKQRIYLDTVRRFMLLHTGQASPRPLSLRECSMRLNSEGYRWRSKAGEPTPIYMENLDDIHPEHYRGFLSDSLIDAVLLRKQANRRREYQRKPLEDFSPPLLWRVAVCDLCGRKLESYRDRLVHSDRYSYKHMTGGCKGDGYIRTYQIDDMARLLPPYMRLINLTDVDKQAIIAAITDLDHSPEPDKRAELEGRLERLEEMRLDNAISRESYVQRHAALIEQLNALPPPAPRTTHTLDEIAERVDNMQATLLQGEPWTVNRLMRELFREVRVNIAQKRIVSYAPGFRV